MATGTGSESDQNKLDDYRLQIQAARDQANRRAAELLPSVIPISSIFEGKSHESSLQLARNQKVDAQEAMAKEPSRENWLALKSARDDIDQQESWRDANRYDVIGFNNELGKLGPLKRWEASETALRTARRAQRDIRAQYAQDPSEDNWWEVRLNTLKIKALEADNDANKGEASWKTFTSPSISNLVLGKLVMNKAFQDEADLFHRYAQLSLQNLRRKQAQGAAPEGSVQGRMLALNSYGPQSAASPSGNTGPRGSQQA
jgi:hypothetical protein